MIKITKDRLPAWAQNHAPDELDGEELADWFLTLMQGREIGQAEAGVEVDLRPVCDEVAQLGSFVQLRLNDLDGVVNGLSRDLEAIARRLVPAPATAALSQVVAAKLTRPAPPEEDEFNPDTPLEPPLEPDLVAEIEDEVSEPGYKAEPLEGMEVQLSDTDYQRVISWAAKTVRDAGGDDEAVRKAGNAVTRQVLGFFMTPDGEQKGPAWKQYPSRGFEGVVYPNLSRLGLVPPRKEQRFDNEP